MPICLLEKTDGKKIHLDFMLCWSYTKDRVICAPSVVLPTGCASADVEQSSPRIGTARQEETARLTVHTVQGRMTRAPGELTYSHCRR